MLAQRTIERYQKILQDKEIHTTFDKEDGFQHTYLVLNDGGYVAIDESSRDVPPHAIHCSHHELQSNRCSHMLAVDWYYQELCKELHKPKPAAVRTVIVEQGSRVEYSILRSNGVSYMTVQMVNGRASNCYYAGCDPLQDVCIQRATHPGVPCNHMQAANALESDVREQARIAKVVEATGVAKPEMLQQVTREEIAKCSTAYQAVMRESINEISGTPEYYKAMKRREKKAKQAYRQQYMKSQERLLAVVQQAA